MVWTSALYQYPQTYLDINYHTWIPYGCQRGEPTFTCGTMPHSMSKQAGGIPKVGTSHREAAGSGVPRLKRLFELTKSMMAILFICFQDAWPEPRPRRTCHTHVQYIGIYLGLSCPLITGGRMCVLAARDGGERANAGKRVGPQSVAAVQTKRRLTGQPGGVGDWAGG
jgi:hypothetical protein